MATPNPGGKILGHVSLFFVDMLNNTYWSPIDVPQSFTSMLQPLHVHIFEMCICACPLHAFIITWFVGHNGQAAIHNHANNIRTVGMGEVAVVMNGVTFRTRHNDYRLNQAHRTSAEFGAYEPVEFPPVPPSVSVPNNTSSAK